jgi:hypothetical protein
MRRHNNAFLKQIQNSRGILTAEFMFSIVLCAGLCIVLFSLNFTLSMAEVAQYVAFSAARAHSAGHVDQDKQEQMAKDKYQELITHSVLKPIFGAGGAKWFQVPEAPDIRGGGVSQKSFDDVYPAFDEESQRIPQVGVRFAFSPKLLNIKIAFLGSTSEDPDAGFTTNISALLIREPSQKECWELQVKKRYSAILKLDSRYKELGSQGENKYIPMEDNGC